MHASIPRPNSRRAASSSSSVTPPPDPRFSRMFTTSLGSPFLTTPDPDLRPPSPTPTADYSIIDMDPEDSPFIPGGYPTISSPMASIGFSRGRPPGSRSASWSGHSPPQNSFKSLLPRLWDALSSPGRAVLNFSPSTNVISTSSSSPSSSRTPSPSSPRRQPAQSWYTSGAALNGRHSPVYWNTKGKARASGRNNSRNEHINYSELPPLDGEEGELIDDEACFIDVPAVTGIDILSRLPPELALHVLTLICPSPLSTSSTVYLNASVSPGRSSAIITEADSAPHEALRALLSCRLVSRAWCRLASDNAVWRALFLGRWHIDLRRTCEPGFTADPSKSARMALGKTWDYDLIDIGPKAKRLLGLSSPAIDAPITSAPLRLDWRVLFHERFELDRRWSGATMVSFPDGLQSRRMGGVFNPIGSLSDFEMTNTRVVKSYEPKRTKLSGHTDSVYCLEFDSRRIITGSRDRTIKVWSLLTGNLLGTFTGHHASVLCLKFEKDWDREWEWEQDPELPQTSDASRRSSLRVKRKTGFMVSGSSDCSVCVWDLELGPLIESDDASIVSDELVKDDGERSVVAHERAVLKGHSGGVLDLRIDKRWIVSCSKDAVIRVWDRRNLKLYRTLRGHEGPVNAVGLQSGRVVSASGDGKMILWDIESGERLRTFEGHDRGLACIEFKDDLIVSGSNDCKIKVWSASTGECLRTLVGHEALVRALSFDPRSGRLVSASYDKSVKLWDLGSGKLVREFKGQQGHTSHIFDVKFDVARIVSTSHDQKIVILDFSQGLNTALFV